LTIVRSCWARLRCPLPYLSNPLKLGKKERQGKNKKKKKKTKGRGEEQAALFDRFLLFPYSYPTGEWGGEEREERKGKTQDY